MNNVYDALLNLGYPVKRSGNYFLTKALFRNGDNPNALSIHQETGRFCDFVSGQRGSWNEFLSLALDGNKESIAKYAQGNFSIREVPKTNYLNLMQVKKYDKSLLKKLIPYYDFYTNRGISKTTLQQFEIGLATSSTMKNRLVFPIYDLNDNIIGFAGRLIHDHEFLPKWLIVGRKTNFTYPLHLTQKYVTESKEVFLVESVGDMLALYESGVKNVVCLFGISMNKEILKYLIGANIKKITIALNNDLNKVDKKTGKPFNPGQLASQKLHAQLRRFFDDVVIVQPPNGKNDYGACDKIEIQKFFNAKAN